MRDDLRQELEMLIAEWNDQSSYQSSVGNIDGSRATDRAIEELQLVLDRF